MNNNELTIVLGKPVTAHGEEIDHITLRAPTTADLIERQLPYALETRPTLITIGIGINDLGLQHPDDAFALSLEEVVVKLARLRAPIVLANLPDLALSPAIAHLVPRQLYEKRIEMFNEHVTATAARHGLGLVDLYRLSREILPGHPELFSADGFHPSALGYEAWAERMLPIVAAALGGQGMVSSA